MDILHLIDRLEELFNNSRPIPLTHNVIVDEDKFLDIIDQMRISVPEEVKKAQTVFSQKDRVMAQAQEEANRTLQLAREKADSLVEKEGLVQDAQRRTTSGARTSARTAATIRSTPSSVVPAARARSLARWITGPSASGSENGTPTSMMSAPARSRARRMSDVRARDGSPAVM